MMDHILFIYGFKPPFTVFILQPFASKPPWKNINERDFEVSNASGVLS